MEIAWVVFEGTWLEINDRRDRSFPVSWQVTLAAVFWG
jgi:hypothetical protein